MKKVLAAMFSAIALAGCAEPVERMVQTPSGRPEVSFASKSAASVSEKLTAMCAQKGWLIQKSSPQEVVCGGTMQGGGAVMTQLLIGNSYSTTPEQYARFTIYPVNGQTRVQLHQWVETQMAFGQVKKLEINGNAQFNNAMKALIDMGGKPVTVGS
ncbi:hypothetical protein [Cribrihabitans neustonicus]|uniref:hypothetical protein n=1 Tax=Cribrihabitans neustonicus TaxID=1429085 RepID=UPI003B5AE6FD